MHTHQTKTNRSKTETHFFFNDFFYVVVVSFETTEVNRGSVKVLVKQLERRCLESVHLHVCVYVRMYGWMQEV